MNNWNDLKIFSREELLEMVPKGFEFKTSPWSHQVAAFLATISNKGFLDALDLGTGKSKVSIDVCRYLDFLNGNKKGIRVLFICLNTAVEKMKDEVETHSDLSAVCVRGNKAEKWKLFNKEFNFYIINYEGLRSLLTDRVKKGTKVTYDDKTLKEKRKDKLKDEINWKYVNRLLSKKFDVLIIDESHIIKTPKSLIFRVVKAISKKVSNRMLLTGTPFGNTLLDVWSQYFIVDNGDTFYPSFSLFKSAYFVDKGYWGPLWKATPKGKKFIEENLYSKALRYREDECNDLPPKVFRVLNYKLSPQQREAYNNLIDDNHDSLTVNIANKSIGFRTIASGFIKSSDYIFKKNPKLELLWDIVENVYEEHKIVIFVEYTMSRKIIEKLLKKKKIKFNTLSGETKDKYKEYSTFQKDDKYRVMVAQIKSGGASIDLFAATYCVHFENGGSVINYKQSIKRIHRGGQTKKCFFYSLIGTGTVEVSIYNDLQNGVDAFAKIVDGEKAKKYIMGE